VSADLENGPSWRDEFDVADEPEWEQCPDHGRVLVVRHESSAGPDPYDVQVLACGGRSTWFGPAASDQHVSHR
jgi:hypothetical protein